MRWPTTFAVITILGVMSLCSISAGAQQITISDVVMNPEGTGTATLTLDSAPHGLSGFNIHLNVSDPSVAEITSVIYPSGFGLWEASAVPFTSGTIRAMDPTATSVPDGSTEVILARVNLRGLKPGVTMLHGTISLISANIPWGDDYTPTTTITDGTITVTGGQVTQAIPKPCPGMADNPSDPDGDGIFEDLSGNGVVDFSDVSAYFMNFEWIRQNEPVSLFDFNKNGMIDFGDIVLLNQET